MVTLDQYPDTAVLNNPSTISKDSSGFKSLSATTNVSITGRLEKDGRFKASQIGQNNSGGDNIQYSGIFYTPYEIPSFIAGMNIVTGGTKYEIIDIIPYDLHTEIYLR